MSGNSSTQTQGAQIHQTLFCTCLAVCYAYIQLKGWGPEWPNPKLKMGNCPNSTNIKSWVYLLAFMTYFWFNEFSPCPETHFKVHLSLRGDKLLFSGLGHSGSQPFNHSCICIYTLHRAERLNNIIIESVDSICRDGTDTPISLNKWNGSDSLERGSYRPFQTHNMAYECFYTQSNSQSR